MEDTPKTQDSTEYSWQERELKAKGELAKVLQKLDYLEAQLRLLTAKRFGRSSEKTSKDQLQLFEDFFNEAESNAESFAPEPELITVLAHQRAKRKKKKGVDLEGLPETVVEYRLPEKELTCSCGHERHIIGQEVTKELVVVPAQFSVTKHVQYVYACRHCENHGDGTAPVVVKAPKPNRAFPGRIASPFLHHSSRSQGKCHNLQYRRIGQGERPQALRVSDVPVHRAPQCNHERPR